MSGYSGKTEALLRAGRAKEGGVQKAVPITLNDGEDGAPCLLNTMTYVQRAALDEPMVVSSMVAASAPSGDPLPANFGAFSDPYAAIDAALTHQAAVRADMVQREASREALRRLLLARETVEWRREQMEETFAAERLTAHEALRHAAAAHAEVIAQKRRAADKAAAVKASQATQRANFEKGLEAQRRAALADDDG